MKYDNVTDDPDYFKKYYHKNKRTILGRVTRKVMCECGKEVSYCNLSKHKKTDVHNRVVNMLEHQGGAFE